MQKYPFYLESLPYPANALEPFIDEATMKIHHAKHHQTYVNNLNAALEANPALHKLTLKEILTTGLLTPAIRNNGGGVYNHNLFWSIMTNHSKGPHGELLEAINKTFGSLDAFKQEFKQASLARFGSGWAWLVKDQTGKLLIISTANQDTPLEFGYQPILTIDVWEHAYYLKYQNKRVEYIDNWFNIINWEQAEKNFQQ